MTRLRSPTLLLGCAFLPFGIAPAAAAQQDVALAALDSDQDLSALSIEELAEIPVRSASKREEPLSAAPTSLYVITSEEILAAGVTSVPEALRLAPNLQVQQVDARQYAITARGFNSVETSNKLLALVDGRTIYSTFASTIFWELHNRPVEDIGQIEVISGPGGTLYGPNAVNGVINIVTRDARDTLGGLVRATAGAQERTAAARYGVALGASGAVRFYGHWFDREDLPTSGIAAATNDDFRGWQAGFRADFGTGPNHFTVQGDVFDTDTTSDDRIPEAGDSGHNLLARWTRQLGLASSLSVQAYYDYFERNFLLVLDSLQTLDLEAQFNATFGAHDLVLGGGIRTTRDEFINNLNPFRLDPPRQRLWVYNAFIQDRFRLSSQLSLILGIKAEETSFTGLELLPNFRISWQPDADHHLWAAVSRAVRTPSRIDRQLQALPLLLPASDFRTEKLIAFEAGYRGQPFAAATVSVSVFYNLYDDVRTTDLVSLAPVQVRLGNGLEGKTYGVEAWGAVQLMPWWRLSLGLSTLWKDFELDPGTIDLAARDSLGHDPNFQLFARSQVELSDRLRLNVGLRYIDDIESAPPIGSYVEADATLTYRLTNEVELFVSGRNLLHETHLESNDPQRAQLAERSVYAGTRLRF